METSGVIGAMVIDSDGFALTCEYTVLLLAYSQFIYSYMHAH